MICVNQLSSPERERNLNNTMGSKSEPAAVEADIYFLPWHTR